MPSHGEIESAVGAAFRRRPVRRADVIAAAIRSSARPEVLLFLIGLPDREYADVGDLLAYAERLRPDA